MPPTTSIAALQVITFSNSMFRSPCCALSEIMEEHLADNSSVVPHQIVH